MIFNVVIFSILCSVVPGLNMASTGSDTSEPYDAASVCRRHLHMWETGDLSEFDKIIAADYVGHVASGTRDREGLRERIRTFRRLYPDIHFEVEDQFSQREKVVTRMRAVGTNSSTGAKTELIGINISRVVDRKVAEEWATWESVTR